MKKPASPLYASVLQRGARRLLGWSLLKRNHPFLRFVEVPPVDGITFALHQAFGAGLAGRTFLQVGANDGSRNDPLERFITSLNWQGTLVEPRGQFIPILKKKYAAQPRVHITQAAVGPETGTRPLYVLKAHLPNLPPFANGLGTLDRARIEQACRDLQLDPQAIAEESVDCLTWEQVSPAFPLTDVEILVIDTEGMDIPLLELWDWSKARPKVVHYEHACATPTRQQTMFDSLRQTGYEMIVESDNTTAYLRRE